MKRKIAVIPGDGNGPEAIGAAVEALRKLDSLRSLGLEFHEAVAGGAAIDATGQPLPERTLDICREADAVLMGPVGGPKWEGLSGTMRPERAVLGLRAGLSLFAAVRPARVGPGLGGLSPLKRPEALDLVLVREISGGIYQGARGRKVRHGFEQAYDTEIYDVNEVARAAALAFGLAAARKGRLCSVDKANVLESSRLWRETVAAAAADWPGVALEHLHVDAAAMRLARDPGSFDVILAPNMFGDILSDLAAALTGAPEAQGAANLGAGRRGLFGPCRPAIGPTAARGAANPLAAMRSAAMMLRDSLGLPGEAAMLEGAIDRVLAAGRRPADMMEGGMREAGSAEMAALVSGALEG